MPTMGDEPAVSPLDKQHSNHLSTIWQHNPDLLSVIDLASATFETVNPAWTTALGWSCGEIEGKPYEDFVHPDDISASTDAFEKVREGDPVLRFENRYRTKDGTWCWLSWVAVPEAGKLYSSTRDITHDRAQAKSLDERTDEINRLWSMTTDLIGTATLDGFLKAVNPAWTKMLGWSEDELLARPFVTIVDPADHAETGRVVARLAAGETVRDFIDHVIAKDGSVKTIMWTAVPDVGTPLFYIVGRDLTDQYKAEDAARQSQKMEAVGQLTGGLAHDFNNMLTVIRGSVDLLRRPTITEDRRIRYLDAIADTADRAAKLTSQLLAFARRSTLRPEAFDVGQNVRDMEGMIGTLIGSRIRFTVDVAKDPCVVDADPTQFDTAIVNMAANARDATQSDGTLHIRVRQVQAIPAIRAHPKVSGRFVAISVTDNGDGIDPKKLDRIFEPFFTTKGVGRGTGLGLSQVFGFAKQSGGEIQVESRLGEGTTFTLYLPRSDDDKMPTGKLEALPLIDGGDACVLVVEDNPEVGQFATQALAELGFKTSLAVDAEHALVLLASGGGYDIVFSDVVMPGMSGIEMAQEIRRLYPAVPVLLVSGYSSKLASSIPLGLEVMTKPYSMEELSRALHRVIDGTKLRN